MARKVRAKVGGFAAALPPDTILTDANSTALENAAGVAFSAAHRRQVAAAITLYREDHTLWAAAPSPSDVAAVIAKVAGRAVALDDALHILDTPPPAMQAARSAIQAQMWRLDKDIGELSSAVGLLRVAASRAVASFPTPSKSDRGQKGDQARVRLAATLLAIFRAAGGKGTISNTHGKPSGAFFDFLKAAMPLAGVTVTDDGIRGLIAKAATYTRNYQKTRQLKDL